MKNVDEETALKIVLIYFFKSLEDCRHSPVVEMVDSRETDFSAKCQEERDFIHEEYIGGHKNFLVELQ